MRSFAAALLLLPGLALAAEAPVPSPATNVRVKFEIVSIVEGKSRPPARYQLLAAVDQGDARINLNLRVPVSAPPAPGAEASKEGAPALATSYQNAGFTAALAVRQDVGGRLLLRGNFSYSTLAPLSSVEQAFSVAMKPGESVTLFEADNPMLGGSRVVLTVATP